MALAPISIASSRLSAAVTAMDELGRGRRATAGQRKGGAEKKSALQQLQELRKGGRQLDNYELKEEEDVYETMDDAEYAKLVAKRREEGGEPLDAGW